MSTAPLVPDSGDGASSSSRKSPVLRRVMIVVSATALLVGGFFVIVCAPGPLGAFWLSSIDLSAIPDPQARVVQTLASASQTVLFALGGLIAIIGVGLSLDRHALALEQASDDRSKESTRIGELIELRKVEQERDLRARFVTAVGLLSDPERATTRQAGMYALAALADDWQAFKSLDERDVCVEVICAYLRSEWDPNDASKAEGERRVREAGFSLIAAHFRPSSGDRSWDGAKVNLRSALVDFRLDFSGVHVDRSQIDFHSARFVGALADFRGLTIDGGAVFFSDATFSGPEASFDGLTVSSGILSFSGVGFLGVATRFSGSTFGDARTFFNRATFEGECVYFDVVDFSAGAVSFESAEFKANEVYFIGARFAGSRVRFALSKFTRGNVSFAKAEFTAGEVSFYRARFQGARIDYAFSTFNGSHVFFGDAKFDDSEVFFNGAKFVGGSVSFEDAHFISGVIGTDSVECAGGVVTFGDETYEDSGVTDHNGQPFRGF